MKLEDIFSEWEKDSEVDRTQLSEESAKASKLHHKYFRILSDERLLFHKQQADKNVLYKDLFDYYVGAMTEEKLKERGWAPRYAGRTLKTDFPMVVEADSEWINFSLKVSLQKEKIEVLESIIKTIANRSFHINNIISWEKFKAGQ